MKISGWVFHDLPIRVHSLNEEVLDDLIDGDEIDGDWIIDYKNQ